MKKYFKLYNIIFYLQSLILFFLLGTSLSAYAGAGKDQGLAASSIVLGYGFITAIFAVISSVFIVKFGKEKVIMRLNIFFILSIIIIFVLLLYR
ncbi:MAG: hypothetical protein H6609_18475 [Ignavibacteriales bacterium]|nr:hypothetical protein [Ignavibacteriales bacterium]